MARVILQPCSPGAPMRHFVDTVEQPVPIDTLRASVSPQDLQQLRNQTTGSGVCLWGLVPNRSVTGYDEMQTGDIVAFVGGRRIFFTGTVGHKFRNPALARQLWGEDNQGRTWEHMYVITDGRKLDIPGDALNMALGYEASAFIRGFTVKTGKPAHKVLDLLGAQTPVVTGAEWVFQSNPALWDLRDFLEQETSGRYAVNQHKDKIRVGDRIWFRISGAASGIYAVGRVTEPPEAKPNDFGDCTCAFQIVEIIEPPLLTDEVKADPILASTRSLTGFQFTNASLPPDVAQRLRKVIAGRTIASDDEGHAALADVLSVVSPRRRPSSGGQGYGLTHAQKKAVEERAVKVATRYYRSQDWAVEDVGKTRSYDLHATRGKDVLHVEVKGTTGSAKSILLTKNEVALHHERYPHTALFVVSSIILSSDGGNWEADGGEPVEFRPWRPDFDDLEASTYRYKVPNTE